MTAIFLFQLFGSCFPTCECPKSEKFQVHYNSASIIAYNTIGPNKEVVKDSVHKNAFGIELSVLSDRIKISSAEKPLQNLGFSAAMACSCVGDVHEYPDPISNIKIYFIGNDTEEKIDVTSNFMSYAYYENKPISLDEYFKEKVYELNGFQIDLVAYQEIPDSAVFVVDVLLESGKILSEQTQIINFYK